MTLQWPRNQPVLSDNVVTIRGFADSDADGLFNLFQDPDIQARTRAPSPYRRKDAIAAIERAHQEWPEAKSARFIATDAHGVVIGACALTAIDAAALVAEAGYAVAAQVRRRGFAQRMLSLLTRWALDEVGLNAVELLIKPTNLASIAVAEAAGFELTGEARVENVKGQSLTLVVYRLGV